MALKLHRTLLVALALLTHSVAFSQAKGDPDYVGPNATNASDHFVNSAGPARSVYGSGFNPPPGDCGASSVQWTVGANLCTAVAPTTVNAQTAVLADTNAPTTGGARFLCDNGVFTEQPGSTCTSSTTNCNPQSVSWTVSGATCTSSTTAVIANGATSATLNDTVIPTTGSARFRCSGGALTVQSGATCTSGCFAGTSVAWTVGGNTCNGILPADVPSGGNSATINDNSAPTTGAATFMCSNGVLSANGGATCNAPPPCPANTANWTVAGQSCSASVPSLINGQSASIIDSTGPATGTATSTCNNGVNTLSLQTCAQGCNSATLNWTVGGRTCTATTPTFTEAGNDATLSDTTGPDTGSANYTCNNGTFALQPGSTCMNAASNCPAGTAVSWSVSGNTCNGTNSSTLSNGAVTTVVDNTAPTTGSSNFTCNNGTLTNSGSTSCDAIPVANCNATTLSWTVGGQNCAGNAMTTAGGAIAAVNSVNGNNGAANFTCNNGVFATTPEPGATCNTTTCTGAVSWTVGGNTCNGTLSGTIANGATSPAVNDNTAPTIGSSTFTCNSGVATSNPGATCAAPASCTGAVTWAVGGNTCTGTLASPVPSGSNSPAVLDSTAPTTGSATFACNNGTSTLNPGATCAVASPCSGAVSWTVGGNTCNGTLAGSIASGDTSPVVTDATQPTTGNSTFTCNNGSATQNAGATCALAAPCSGAVTWTVGGNTCNGTLAGSVPSGSTSPSVVDSTQPTTGSSTFTCNNGAVTQTAGATCSQSCAGAVSWTANGNTCNGTLPAALGNGATSPVITDSTQPTTGSSTFTCNNGSVTQNGGATCLASCTGPVAWTVGGNTCNGDITGTVTSGTTSPTVIDSTGPSTGNASFSCNNGTLTQQAGASCSVPTPCSGSVSWSVNGQTCTGALPAQLASGATSPAISDVTAPTTGQSTFTCSNGTAVQNPGATCATACSGNVTWTVGGNTCDGTLSGSIASGNTSPSVTDSTGPTMGSASFVCNNGTSTAAPGATCAVPPSPCTGAVTWTVGGNTCNGTLAGSVPNGTNTPLVSDTTAPTTGSATFTCNSGATVQNPGATCEASCTGSSGQPAGTYVWLVGGNTCMGTTPGSFQSGQQTPVISDSTAPTTGSASFTCVNGVPTVNAGATCNAGCTGTSGQPAGTYVWSVGANTCSGTLAGTVANGAVTSTILDNTAPITGSATFVCNNGTPVQNPGAVCGGNCGGAVSWSVGSSFCDANLPTLAPSQSASVTDNTGISIGSANYTCNNGTPVLNPGSTCAPPAGSCQPAAVSWTVGANTCNSQTSTILLTGSNSGSLTDTTVPNTGAATFNCNNGSLAPAAGATCAASCNAGTAVNWSAGFLGVNTCNGTLPFTVASGTTTRIFDDQTPRFGSADYVCNNGTLTRTGTPTCAAAAPASCPAGAAVSWTAGGNTCNSTSTAVTASGGTFTANDSTTPTTGTATIRCNNGALTADPGATCATSATTCSGAVSWTVNGNTCNGILPSPVTNGQLSGQVTDSTAPSTGSSSFTCTNGVAVQNGGATCNVPLACSGAVNWTVNGQTCSGTLPSAVASGGTSAPVDDTVAPAVGSATFACSNGVSTQNPGATCSTQCSGPVTWMVGGNTCDGNLATPIASGSTSGTITDSAAPSTGSATFTCANGVATQNAGATCNVPAACSGNVTWTVGGNTCNGVLPSTVPSGSVSGSVSDSTAPTTGTATFSCANGTSTVQAGATCNAPSPNCLAGATVTWNSEFDTGDTCTGTIVTTVNNGATSTTPIYDTDFSAVAGTAGFTNFSCSNGVATPLPGRRCGRPPKQVTDVAVNGRTACVVQSDRTVKCSGLNFYGQHANGTATDSVRFGPTQFTNVSSIALSQASSCAITTTGRTICAGSDGSGNFGRGSAGPLVNSSVTDVTPFHPSGGYTKISMGGFHSCGIHTSGQLYCWGANTFGELGIGTADGTNAIARAPTAVPGMTNIIDVKASTGSCPNGEMSCSVANNAALGRFTCAVNSGGQVFCWGKNDSGQLGLGDTTNRTSPTLVPGLTNITSITTGLGHACARISSGALRCWGNNLRGQLGDNSGTTRLSPVAVNNITTASEVKADSYTTCAVLADGTGRCWGNNAVGEVGNNAAVGGGFTVPQALFTPPGAASGLTKIEVGINNVCARLSSGTVTCWGRKDLGEIADGSPVSTGTPSGRNFPFFGFEQ